MMRVDSDGAQIVIARHGSEHARRGFLPEAAARGHGALERLDSRRNRVGEGDRDRRLRQLERLAQDICEIFKGLQSGVFLEARIAKRPRLPARAGLQWSS